MKRVIEGIKFDTDKSHKVCDIRESNRSDFHCLDCALYVTPRSHRFFLSGWGGAMTRFAHKCTDNSWCGWEKIIPLEKEEAMAYAKKYANNDIINKFFDAKERNDEKNI